MSAHQPEFGEFRRVAAGCTVVPVHRTLLSDTLTPVTAFARLGDDDGAFLFESVIGGERVGRYSFLGRKPFLEFFAHGTKAELRSPPGAEMPPAVAARGYELRAFDCPDPLAELDRLLRDFRAPHLPGLPRFTGGAVGYAGYDSVRYMEKLPNAPTDDRGLPDVWFGFYDRMVLFDHISKLIHVVALAHLPADAAEPVQRQAYDAAAAVVDELVTVLSAKTDDLKPADIVVAGALTKQVASNMTRDEYEGAVRKCLEYIRAGDFFQIVLSQRFSTRTPVAPFEIYRTLRVVNPSPFMVYMRTPSACLVASSPEIMVRVENGVVTTRPLAGTRPRGATGADDERLAAELLADPKERAEHIMLVDLGRNDVGRVAEFQSVRLSDVMTVERYSHVMHITSNVCGDLRPGLTPLDALRACLPAGTVSGAPKVRAMQVIDELEPHRRGPYAGAIGYVDFTSNMDTCIALRTLVMVGDMAYVQAGAGIVYDSVPSAEYEETLNKAKGLLRAIELTETRCAAGKIVDT
ncbi:MAG: anthranilate synthase component I [Planctomycetia bacterium]